MRLTFDNPLDAKKFDRSLLRMSPEPEGLRVSVNGAAIELRGRTRGRTKYTVTALGALLQPHIRHLFDG